MSKLAVVPRCGRAGLPLILAVLGISLLLGSVQAGPTTVDAPRVPLLLRLADPPTAQVYAQTQARAGRQAAVTAAQAHLRILEERQRTLLDHPLLHAAPVLFRTQRVYNGVAVLAHPEEMAALAALPGVDRVQALPAYTPALVRSVPWVGAPQVWRGDLGVAATGRGITIGIIDTGVDYLHTHFGGPGTGYAGNDPTTITDVVAGLTFPTAKVVGGWDFVGDTYNGLDQTLPSPDPDPMDCWGHGTHVAGIAAGYGVLQDGRTYTGTYTAEIPWTQMAIGPGVAPQASLVALKIFGCNGVSYFVNPALEWAVDPNGDGDFSDHLDVVNLSIGSAFGMREDPSAEAADNAALAGVVVVAAAGNTGDTYYSAMAPGSADRALSVGASSIQGLPFPDVQTTTPAISGVDVVASFSARGPRRGAPALKPEILAPGQSIASAQAGSGSGVSIQAGTSMATPFVSGAMALLRELHPGWRVEELKALAMNSALHNAPLSHTPPLTFYGPGRAGAGRLDLAQAARTDVLLYAADAPGQVALAFGRLDALGPTQVTRTVRLVNKGPLTRTYHLAYMPVVDMPAADIRPVHPGPVTLRPHDAVNLAVALDVDGDRITRSPDPSVRPTLTFPRHRLDEESGYLVAWPQPARFQARLGGEEEVPPVASSLHGDLSLALDPADGHAAVTVTLDSQVPVTVTQIHLHVGHATANGPVVASLLTATVPVTRPVTVTARLTLTQSLLANLVGGFVYANVHTQDLPDGAARGQLSPLDPVVRIPVYAAPRPVSAMEVQEPVLDLGTRTTATFTVTLAGRGLLTAPDLAQARFPTDTVSVVSLLELQAASPNERSSPTTVDHADLKYVGVATDRYAARARGAADPVAASRLLFGLVTYGEWATPNQLTFRIELDPDEDGQAEYRLYTTSYGSFRRLPATDEFFAALSLQDENGEPVKSTLTYPLNLVSPLEMETRLLDNSVMLLAVDAADIGLDQANPDLNYRVVTFSQDNENEDEPVDTTPWLHYDLSRPGLWTANPTLSDFPIFFDLPQTKIPVTVDRDGIQHNRSQGLLVLHHFNEAEQRAEVVQIEATWPLYLPWIAR